MPTEPPTLALLHEQALLRQALARMLAELPGYAFLAQLPGATEFKRHFALGPAPQLLLLSVEAATAERCTLLLWLGKHLPGTRLLLLGTEPPTATLLAALCAGAHGYHCTRDPQDRLLLVLGHLLHGATHFPAEVMAQLHQLRPALEPGPAPGNKPISTCQQEFLRWLVAPGDLTYAEIAQRMGKKVRCIHKYRDKLFKRFGVNSKGGLILVAIRLGLDKP